jgi:hypothetical protein
VTAIAERVAAGAAFLDEHDPEWWRPDVDRAIDLERLDLGDASVCILGQRCPLEVLRSFRVSSPLAADDEESADAYDAYFKHLSGMGSVEGIQWGADHGFTFAIGGQDNWRGLTAEWKRVITERRAAS